MGVVGREGGGRQDVSAKHPTHHSLPPPPPDECPLSAPKWRERVRYSVGEEDMEEADGGTTCRESNQRADRRT